MYILVVLMNSATKLNFDLPRNLKGPSTEPVNAKAQEQPAEVHLDEVGFRV